MSTAVLSRFTSHGEQLHCSTVTDYPCDEHERRHGHASAYGIVQKKSVQFPVRRNENGDASIFNTSLQFPASLCGHDLCKNDVSARRIPFRRQQLCYFIPPEDSSYSLLMQDNSSATTYERNLSRFPRVETLEPGRQSCDFAMIDSLHTDDHVARDNVNLVHLIKRAVEVEDEQAGTVCYDIAKATGLHVDEHTGCHLIYMFTFFNNFSKASQVFDDLPSQNVHTWSAIITAHAKCGHLKQAIQLYQQMKDVHMEPDSYAYVAILEACSAVAAISEGRTMHSEIIGCGYIGHMHISNVLISMYNRCGSFEDACLVLQRLPNADIVTWNSLITSNGDGIDVLQIYDYMQSSGIKPDRVTYTCAIKACYGTAQLEQGRMIHCDIVGSGVNSVVESRLLGNSLIVMYSKYGCLEGACAVFESLPERDVVTWNALIDGYSKHGFAETALKVYHAMCRAGVEPTLVTFVCTLKACSVMQNIKQGRKIHAQLVIRGLKLDPIIENTLLDLYGKCGRFEDAEFIFDSLPEKSVITWNTLIAGYSSHHLGYPTLGLFWQMQQEGLQPDSITLVCVLKACSSLLDLEQGRGIHSHIVKVGMDSDTYIGNILITMYGHCGSVEDAQSVFDLSRGRDVVTWSALMMAHIHDGHGKEVLQMFKQMQSGDLEPDEAAFVCALKACAHTAALEQGMELHAYALERGCEFNTPIVSSLITMYGKCGNLHMALLVFNRLRRESVVCYNAMLTVFGEHGESRSSILLYKSMAHAGVKPNNITFTCLLSASRSLDLVDEGFLFFNSMQRDHGIVPETEHYGCMVEILGKTGHKDAAEDLVETFPAACNIVCWTSLLNSCNTHADLRLGRRCFNHAVNIKPSNTSVYVLMSRLYEGSGLHREAMEVENLRKHRNKWKKPGKAYIEVNREVYEFVVGDKTHPNFEEINLKVKELSRMASEKGLIPESSLLKDSDDNLCGHSEKLAIAFGLFSTNAGTTIRVAKNIRMCMDCHTTAKLTSSIENREIIVSDSYCVHSFREGVCSCKD